MNNSINLFKSFRQKEYYNYLIEFPFAIVSKNSRLPTTNAQVLAVTFYTCIISGLTVTADFRELIFETTSALSITFADGFLVRFTPLSQRSMIFFLTLVIDLPKSAWVMESFSLQCALLLTELTFLFCWMTMIVLRDAAFRFVMVEKIWVRLVTKIKHQRRECVTMYVQYLVHYYEKLASPS